MRGSEMYARGKGSEKGSETAKPQRFTQSEDTAHIQIQGLWIVSCHRSVFG